MLYPVILLHDVNEHQKQQHIILCPFGDKRALTINESIWNASQISFHHSPLSSLLILSSSCVVFNDFLSFTLPLATPIYRVHRTEKFHQISWCKRAVNFTTKHCCKAPSVYTANSWHDILFTSQYAGTGNSQERLGTKPTFSGAGAHISENWLTN